MSCSLIVNLLRQQINMIVLKRACLEFASQYASGVSITHGHRQQHTSPAALARRVPPPPPPINRSPLLLVKCTVRLPPASKFTTRNLAAYASALPSALSLALSSALTSTLSLQFGAPHVHLNGTTPLSS